ncbi:MAG: hypothetical protein ACRC1P_09140, partial [Cellulosilyticaceae bacterium]
NKQNKLISQGIFIQGSNNGDTGNLGQKMQYALLGFREAKELVKCSESTVVFPNQEGIMFETVEKQGEGIYLILDLGEESSGYITLELETMEPCEVVIGYGEHLEDMRVRSFVGGRNFAAGYQAKQGRQVFTYWMKRIGLRYIQLHIYSKKFKLYYAGIKPVEYPLNDEPKLLLSDHLHQKIYEVCKRTLSLCMHDHYEDTPWREQALYSMDSRNQMLCGYYAFGEYKFPRASLELMALSLREDGLLELCSPGEVAITIPSFSLIFIVQCYEYWLYSGDEEFIKKYYSAIKCIIESFEKREAENGLVSQFIEPKYWNFYEWQEGLDGSVIERKECLEIRYELPLNAFYLLALKDYSKLCTFIEGENKGKKYKEKVHYLGNEINEVFWDKERLAYRTYEKKTNNEHFCELAQALMLLSEEVPQNRIQETIKRLREKEILSITLSHSIFKYEALLKFDSERAQETLDEVADIWGKMLFEKSTSFWETEKGAGDFGRAGSLCHGWSAIPLYLYYAYVLGIKPEQANQYTIKPIQLTNLQVKGSFRKNNGEILKIGSN